MLAAATLPPALGLALSYLAVAVLPGPNFVVVSHAGLASSQRGALRAVCGVALGAALLTLAATLFAGSLPRSAELSLGMDVLFAALLLRFAARAFGRAWSASMGRGAAAPRLDDRYFRRGFLCATANPFTAAFLVSVPKATLTGPAATAIVFATAVAWFGLVACASCHPLLRGLFSRRRAVAEAVMGVVLLAMAARTLLRALAPFA